MLDADYLFLSNSMVLIYAHERGNCYFENKHTHTEIQADELIDLLTDLSKSAENPLQNIELTPEFEAVEPVKVDNCQVNTQDIGTDILDTNADIKDNPKFVAGDKVYFGVHPKIQAIESVHAYNNIKFIGTWGCALARDCCHATPENHERLQATFPDIKFEQPPKPLTGSDLAKVLIKKGWVGFNCLCGHIGDEHAITETIVIGINDDGKFITFDDRLFNNAIPMKGWRPLKAQEVGL